MVSQCVSCIGSIQWLQREIVPTPVIASYGVHLGNIANPEMAARLLPSFLVIGNGAYLASFNVDVSWGYRRVFRTEILHLAECGVSTAFSQELGESTNEEDFEQMRLSAQLFPLLKQIQENLHPTYASEIISHWWTPSWCFLNLTIRQSFGSDDLLPELLMKHISNAQRVVLSPRPI